MATSVQVGGLRSLDLRNFLRAALDRAVVLPVQEAKLEVVRVLNKAKELGWIVDQKSLYTGGYELTVYDGKDKMDMPVTVTFLHDRVCVSYADDYFTVGYVAKVTRRYDPEFDFELEAEARNEEALYGHAVYRPWCNW